MLQSPIPLTVEDWRAQGGPDYSRVFEWRIQQIKMFREQPFMLAGALKWYSTRPVEFICHWCDTVDPRNAGQPGKLVKMPFVIFERQKEIIEFLEWCRVNENDGLMEKCRDFGATWIAAGYSAWLWRFVKGASVGWGSRKEQLVDKIGDMDSIFEKIRSIITNWPREFYPKGFSPTSDQCMSYMRIVNPDSGATITGEAGDNIGRGGRKLIYFKDESAHYVRPEAIEAALSDNTRVQIDISSVKGIGNVFHRRRESGYEWNGNDTNLPEGKTAVFVCDWRQHPGKTQEWYDKRKAKFTNEGLAHVFAQEVDRNYAAAVEGVIIPQEYVDAAVDAHIKLGINCDNEPWSAALDVADGGVDRNAFIGRRGILLCAADEWGSRDTGVTARKVVDNVSKWKCSVAVQYDCIGVGAGVKAEINRLIDDGTMPEGVIFVPWNAGGKVQKPFGRVIENDDESSRNKDFFQNLKAQAWQSLYVRFLRTYQAVVLGADYDPETLISIDSKLPFLFQLKKELSQATRGLSGSMKMIVNKTPEGTKSPNLADGAVMCYFPVQNGGSAPIFGTQTGQSE